MSCPRRCFSTRRWVHLRSSFGCPREWFEQMQFSFPMSFGPRDDSLLQSFRLSGHIRILILFEVVFDPFYLLLFNLFRSLFNHCSLFLFGCSFWFCNWSGSFLRLFSWLRCFFNWCCWLGRLLWLNWRLSCFVTFFWRRWRCLRRSLSICWWCYIFNYSITWTFIHWHRCYLACIRVRHDANLLWWCCWCSCRRRAMRCSV